MALSWGVEGRTRNSWVIQPTAIWGHDMVFSRSPFLPPRLRHAHPLGFASPQTRNAWLLLDFHVLSNTICPDAVEAGFVVIYLIAMSRDSAIGSSYT